MDVGITETEYVAQAGVKAQSQVPAENAQGLRDGEVISASVELLEGNAITLRTDSGALVRATLQGDVSLAQGDSMEAIVSRRGQSCVLYILDISRGDAQEEQNAQAAPQAVSQHVLSGMMSAMRRNPGMDAGMALFFTENNIADTPENVSAFTLLSQGTGVGNLLGRILGAMARPEEGLQAGLQPGTQGFAEAGALPQSGSAPAGGNAAAQDAAAGGVLPIADGIEGAVSDQTEGAQTQSAQTAGAQPQAVPARTAGAQPQALRVPAEDMQMQTVNGQAESAQAQSASVQAASTPAEATPAQAADAQMQFSLTQTGNAQAEIAPAQAKITQPEPTLAQRGDLPQAESEAVRASGAGLIVKAPAETEANAANFQSATGKMQQPPPDAEAMPRHTEGPRAAETPAQRTPAPGSTINLEDAAKAAESQTQEQGGAGKARAGDSARIGDIIRGIFVRPDAKTGRFIKKSADELPQAVKALKSALVQSDINNKEVCLQCADQALRQMEFGSRTVPFEYMQLPVSVKDGAYQTAELYVFRRQGKQKASGEAGFTILVALDTQHIGRVETLIKEAGGSVSLEFRLEQPETMEMFKRNEPELAKAVESAGYRLTGLRYAGLEIRTSVLNAAETAGLDAGAAAESIDVRI